MALIIKSLGVDPPNYDELSDDEDDFVKDPAQYRDQLPQPYRYIDEILNLFLDDVWDEITQRENERIAERSKTRPPKYECAVQLQEFPNAKVLSASTDGRYLFVAYPGGLSVLEAGKRKVLYTLDDDRLDIYKLTCTIIGPEVYILTGIDELGMTKVFGCAVEKLFFMNIFNEEAVNSKLHVVKCLPSIDGDYLGLVSENPTNNDTVLEVYQLPKDVWNKEIEDIKSKLLQPEETKPNAVVPNTQTQLDESEETEAAEKTEAAANDATIGEEEPIISARKSTESHSKKSKKTNLRPRTKIISIRTNSANESPQAMKKHSKRMRHSAKIDQKQQCKTAQCKIDKTKSESGSFSSQPQSKSASRIRYKPTSRSRIKTGSKKDNNFKFTTVTLVMRQYSPENLAANPGASPASTLKELSDPKSILGSGQGHLLTKPYMDIRQESFNALHQDRFIYKRNTVSDELDHRECNFHFFTPGLAIPYGIEQPGALKKPTCIGVWWSGGCQFVFYCLTKPVKTKKPAATEALDTVSRRGHVNAASKLGQADLNAVQSKQTECELKPETVWPQTAAITASGVSPDSSLVAIGLQSGIVTIWDKYLCCVRKSVTISKSAVIKLDFMDSAICPQSNNPQQPYPTTTSCYVLVRCEDSSLYLLNCGQLDYSPPIALSDKSTEDDTVITSVKLFPARCPEIILRIAKGGNMFLQDVVSTNILCEIALPSTHELTTPWQPILAVAAYGQMLYLKGAQKGEEEYVENTKESIFVFQLRSFPALDAYWMKKRNVIPYIAMSPMETRVSTLLTHRVKSSGSRQLRLQQRWPLMKQELIRISHIKSH